MMDTDELRKRGVEFLISQQKTEKQPHEFNIKELCHYWKISETTAYRRINKLVDRGEWKTRWAYDNDIHKSIKVWWISDGT